MEQDVRSLHQGICADVHGRVLVRERMRVGWFDWEAVALELDELEGGDESLGVEKGFLRWRAALQGEGEEKWEKRGGKELGLPRWSWREGDGGERVAKREEERTEEMGKGEAKLPLQCRDGELLMRLERKVERKRCKGRGGGWAACLAVLFRIAAAWHAPV